jgi:hypothetical protein
LVVVRHWSAPANSGSSQMSLGCGLAKPLSAMAKA